MKITISNILDDTRIQFTKITISLEEITNPKEDKSILLFLKNLLLNYHDLVLTRENESHSTNVTFTVYTQSQDVSLLKNFRDEIIRKIQADNQPINLSTTNQATSSTNSSSDANTNINSKNPSKKIKRKQDHATEECLRRKRIKKNLATISMLIRKTYGYYE